MSCRQSRWAIVSLFKVELFYREKKSVFSINHGESNEVCWSSHFSVPYQNSRKMILHLSFTEIGDQMVVLEDRLVDEIRQPQQRRLNGLF